MVARCFARRHLVLPRGAHRQSISTTSAAQQRPLDPTTPGVEVGQEKTLRPGFFSSTHRISHAFQRGTKGARSGEGGPLRTSSAHPLVGELRTELYNKEITRSPERVWNLYVSIYEAAQQTSPGLPSSSTAVSTQPSLRLSSRDHQGVLVALTHKTKLEKRLAGMEPSLVTYRYEGSLLDGGNVRNITSYLQRVAFIFSQLRQSEEEGVPNVKDYDHVLSRLAPGGNMPALTALWAQMTGGGVDDLGTRKRYRSVLGQIESREGIEPSRLTYLHLMMGINRHLTGQIERAHRQQITNAIWRGQGKRRKKKETASALAASKGTARYGQEVAPQARMAVKLSSARTISLLQDMFQRNIRPGKMTLDLALRMLRMAGNLEGLRMLIKVAFAIDFKNPDTDPRVIEGRKITPVLTPNVHTLNTIVMAFGEHGTVSEMVLAYETLSRPLLMREVEASVETEEQVDSGSPFATDWRGIFKRDAEVGQSSEEGSLLGHEETRDAADTPYYHPLAVMPNTTTMATMIKSCCSAPDPSRMVAAPDREGGRAMRAKEEDLAIRQDGGYIHVACYLLTEAVELQKQETARMARQLGVEMPRSDDMLAKVVAWTTECEGLAKKASETSTPDEKEDKYAFVRRLAEEGKEPAAPSVEAADDFAPHFLPPALAVNYHMIQPIALHASRKRSAGFALWRFLIDKTQQAIAIKVCEQKILSAAIDRWGELIERQDEGETSLEGEAEASEEAAFVTSADTAKVSHHLSQNTVGSLLTALRKQRRMVRGEVNALGSSFIETMIQRFAVLRSLRKAKRRRQDARQREDTKQMEDALRDEEQRRLRIAAQREQEREDRAAGETASAPSHDSAAVEPVLKG